ncbi:MAG: DUF1959 family protein [Methanobacteriaceae archaeon]|nr:DUF1959 family protein [Methanobacteriaceae archaeon]
MKSDSNDKDELLLKVMKERIIRSYRWHEDVIIPFAEELDIEPEQLEDILMKRMDMSSLEALHARFEQSQSICIKEKIHADLRLCWLSDIMEVLTREESDQIKNNIAREVLNGKSYQEAIEDGRKELLEHLMR